TNFSTDRLTFPLVVSIDGKTVSEQTITLDPQVKRNVIVPFTHQGGGQIRVEAQVKDDLAADNVVYGVIPAPRRLTVVLVSPGNLFLEKARQSDHQVVLETKARTESRGGMGGYGVVVLDSVSPPRVGAGRSVLVNAVPGDVPIEPLGTMEQPVILDW